VLYSGQRARFPREANDQSCALIIGHERRKDEQLQRHAAAGDPMRGLVDDPHRSASHLAQQMVVAQVLVREWWVHAGLFAVPAA
jgi:hypothetical protein